VDTLDWRERVLNLPLWAVGLTVLLAGLILGFVLAQALQAVQESLPAPLEPLATVRRLAILWMPLFTAFKWLFDTFILWIAVRITGRIAGEPFRVGFWEGYRTMLPITMLKALNSSVTLLLALVTQLWWLLIMAWFIDLFILRYFLEMDWYEVFLLNAVLGFFSCVTGGLL
jgi:hypothetical protein